MLLADVVATSDAIAATRSRTAKMTAIAALLRAAEPDDVGPVTAWLVDQTLQGRLGAGWRTLTRLALPSADAAVSDAPADQLSVADVEAAFAALAGSSGTGSAARRQALITELLTRASAPERAFLSSLLAGELRQGALEGVMLEAIASATQVPAGAVRRAAMLTGSLPHTAQLALAAPTPQAATSALEAVRLTLGRPVRPMLASPAASLDAAMEELGDDVRVEHKLDGARIQVHLEAGAVRVWTRTLKDVTARVPELVEVVRSLPARAAVLDGETLALTDDGRPRPFQETASRFGAQAGELALHPYFFDCLHVDGTDLLDAPLHERLAALEQVAGPYRIPGLLRPSRAAAADLLAAALGAGHEGVMVKAASSTYAAGRRGRAWQKVKPVHTLDLVVLGAEWGYGRRTGSLSNIHLGARDAGGDEPVMVGKTFKGMTDELLAWQTATFPALVRSQPSPGVVLLRPELVVEVAVDGVQRSPRYPGGVALRFARVVRYRPDKDAAEADTLEAVRALLPGLGADG